MSLGNRLAVEALGTFWLVFGGCGSAVRAAALPEVRALAEELPPKPMIVDEARSATH